MSIKEGLAIKIPKDFFYKVWLNNNSTINSKEKIAKMKHMQFCFCLGESQAVFSS